MEPNAPQANLDANETAYFYREFEDIKTMAIEQEYPALELLNLLPKATDTDPGAQSITYRIYDRVGQAAIVADYADDPPRIDVVGREVTRPLKTISDAYGYSIQEIRNSQRTGRPLDRQKSVAAREIIDTKINSLILNGDDAHGLYGLMNHPNVPSTTVANDGTGGSTEWTSKTSALIQRDMRALMSGVATLTKGIERPDTLLVSQEEYDYAAGTQFSEASDTTVLDFFLATSRPTNPNLVVIPLVALNGQGTGGTGVMIALNRSRSKLLVEIPTDFEQLPPQARNFEQVVLCFSRFGGVNIFRPLSVSIADGI